MSTRSARVGRAIALTVLLPVAALAQSPPLSAPAELPAPVVIGPPDEPLPPPMTSLPPEAFGHAQEAWSHPPTQPYPAGMAMWSAGAAPHLVLRPHASGVAPTPHLSDYESYATNYREHVAGPRTALPGATTLHLQKMPYSYGYFGAANHRHWSLHYGHQQNYTQWTER